MKTTIVLFGITGDLSKRKLLPALEAVYGSLPQPFELIGVTRQDIQVSDVVSEDSVIAPVTTIVTMDLNEEEGYRKLWQDRLNDPERQVLVFLAVPPLSISMIVGNLGTTGFASPTVKLLLEKPFGMDEQTAEGLFGELSEKFDEAQLYFVDHYLGKRVARSIASFRRQAPALSSVWNKENIDRVEIRAAETIDIEGRAAFYEQTGAMRDVLQGHLLQLLALTVSSVDSSDDMLRARRAQALFSLIPANPEYAVRGQYTGYRDEAGSPNSRVETCAELTFYSEDPNWEGVPMILTTGKGLSIKETVARIYFRDTNHLSSGCLTFNIQPEDHVTISFEKEGRLETDIVHEVEAYSEQLVWNGYENVFLDAIAGDKTFFVSEREVLASWRAVSRVLQAWQLSTVPLIEYQKGATIESIVEKYRTA